MLLCLIIDLIYVLTGKVIHGQNLSELGVTVAAGFDAFVDESIIFEFRTRCSEPRLDLERVYDEVIRLAMNLTSIHVHVFSHY